MTGEWWEQRRSEFELFVSALVMQEAGCGGEQFAQRRLHELAAIPVLALTEEATALAHDLVEDGPLPKTAHAVGSPCLSRGYAPPIICTPEELMGG